MRISRRHCLAALGLHAGCGRPSRQPTTTIENPDHALLHLRRTPTPIQKPVTKLGGQPVWVDTPAWPQSRKLGIPMLFIGQVVIEPALFHTPPGRIAYIFITGDPRVDETWEPRGGENAVIIQQVQPGRQPVTSDGPKLTETIWRDGKPIQLDIELEATLEFRAEPDHIEIPPTQLSPKARQKLGLQLAINEQKIGGAPHWVQTGERAPTDFKLLLQLSNYPVTDDASADNQRMLNPNFNFGTGTGYAMINAAATEGVLLWECD